MLEDLFLSVEIRILKQLNFLGGKLWQHWVPQLHDPTAPGFSIITFLHGGTDMEFEVQAKLKELR